MNAEILDKAINGIRPELIEEAADINFVPVKKPVFKYAGIAAVLALCIVSGTFAVSHITKKPSNTTNNISDTGENDIFGGGTGDNNENNLVLSSPPEIKGTPFTDDEIKNFIEKNKEHIACTISAEYQNIGEEIQIFTKGYYHVVLRETSCVDLDYLTLPICIDNKIIANIEVSRYNGEIIYTINAGGNKWDKMNEALEYSDNAAFVFSGFADETAIAPDNTVFEITPYAKGSVIAGYDLLATEYNTFSIAELNNRNNYVTVKVTESDLQQTTKKATTSITVTGEQIETSETSADNESSNSSQSEEEIENIVTAITSSNLAVTTPLDATVHEITETVAYTTKADPVVTQGDGNVLIIAEFSEQIGKQPLRVSKGEAEMLINMFNEIELEPVDQPVHPENPMDEVFGGGYIMYIDGGDKIVIRGNRNVMINDKFYYDVNNKSDALSDMIGYVLYGYYGEP